MRREQARLMRVETKRVMSWVTQLEEEARVLEERAMEKRKRAENLMTDLERRGNRVYRASPV